MCIVGSMKLTKNTNKRVRQYVDGVLKHFELVRGDDTCYRELYEAIDGYRYHSNCNREQFIKGMCESYGCMTVSQAEHKRRLMSGGLMGSVENLLETL